MGNEPPKKTEEITRRGEAYKKMPNPHLAGLQKNNKPHLEEDNRNALEAKPEKRKAKQRKRCNGEWYSTKHSP